MTYQRVWVDRDRIDCQGRCKEEVNGSLLVYCLYCHHDLIVNNSCLYVLGNYDGTMRRRCRRSDVDERGYCTHHRGEWKPKRRMQTVAGDTVRGLGSLFEAYGHEVVDTALTDIAERVARDISLPANSLLDVLDEYSRSAEQIYFIRSNRYVKIGRSLRPEQRLNQLKKDKGQTVIPDGVDMEAAEIVAQFPGGRRSESAMHFRFAKHRVAGEWFVWSKDLREFVESVNAGREMSMRDIARAVQAEMKL